MTKLVTGGASFIGSSFVPDWLAQTAEPIVNLDKLTYAVNLEKLASLQGDVRHIFVRGGWRLAATFEASIRKTVHWYLTHPERVGRVKCGAYSDWMRKYYSEEAAA